MKKYHVLVESSEVIEVEADDDSEAEKIAVDTVECGFNDWKATILDFENVEE